MSNDDRLTNLLEKTTDTLQLLQKGFDSKLEKRVKHATIWATVIFAIQLLGVAFAVISYINDVSFNKAQIALTKRNERINNAIEIVNKVYNSEFIHSYAMLDSNTILNNNEIIKAFNLVFNTYYIAAIVYNNSLDSSNAVADKKIIAKAIKAGINSFITYDAYTNSSNTHLNPMKEEIKIMVDDIKLIR